MEYIQDYQGKKGQPVENFVFNNMVLSPSLTSNDGTNPGFSTFDYTRQSSGLLFDLQMHFLRIQSTYNLSFPIPPLTDPRYKFIDFYWEENFKLRNLTGAGMVNFMDYLMSHTGPDGEDELVDLLGDKAGFDPDKPSENTLIRKIYQSDGFIGDASTRARVYCIVSRGLHIQEVIDCIANYKPPTPLNMTQDLFLQ